MSDQQLRLEIIASFADAYQNLGYSSLMGKIVALLLLSEEPLSLDDISERLDMSKGPISQIARRLKDNRIIERVWVKGERKDYYRASDDIFGEAFKNYMGSMRRNMQIAERYQILCREKCSDEFAGERMEEMRSFYELLEKHNRAFMKEWVLLHEEKFKQALA
ncbi:MarR family transcriptional regulator [bacterium]|nr:MAG: MarR family transcriptional regulator [bacterium]